jgi:hypothetical protein
MKPLEGGVIDHIFKLRTKIVNFSAKFRVKLCKVLDESENILSKLVKCNIGVSSKPQLLVS